MRDVILSRGGKRDAIGVGLPTVSERLQLATAHRAALGYVGDESEPSRPADGQDLHAVLLSALGLSIRSGCAVKLPTLRDAGRDVVRHGELVGTVLFDGGYTTILEYAPAGDACLAAVIDSLAPLRVDPGFGAPGPESSPRPGGSP